VEVIHMPSDDYSHMPPTEPHQTKVKETAEIVAARLDDGKAVLITCRGGYNRSGLVTGYSLHLHLGWDGEKVVWWVRSKRDFALHNKRFAGWLSGLPAKGLK
jgi:protein-tyrosine phosphatase